MAGRCGQHKRVCLAPSLLSEEVPFWTPFCFVFSWFPHLVDSFFLRTFHFLCFANYPPSTAGKMGIREWVVRPLALDETLLWKSCSPVQGKSFQSRGETWWCAWSLAWICLFNSVWMEQTQWPLLASSNHPITSFPVTTFGTILVILALHFSELDSLLQSHHEFPDFIRTIPRWPLSTPWSAYICRPPILTFL